MMSSTRVRDCFSLRFCVLNYRTTEEDLARVLDRIVATGEAARPGAGAAGAGCRGRTGVKKLALWVAGSVLVAAVFVRAGLGDPLTASVASIWLVLIPALSAGRELPPADQVRDARIALYLSSAAVLMAAGGLTFLAWGGLADGQTLRARLAPRRGRPSWAPRPC